MSYDERTRTIRLSDDGQRLVIVERWLDRQVTPPRWRTKHRTQKLSRADLEYYRQRDEERLGQESPAETIPRWNSST